MAQLPEYHKYNYDLTPKMTLFIEEIMEELGPFAERLEFGWLYYYNHKNGKTFGSPSLNSSTDNDSIKILLGCNRGKISIAVLIHEVLHALGFLHCKHRGEFSAKGFSQSYSKDSLSHEICKDLYGFGDIFLLFKESIKETFKYKGIVKEILEK